MPQQQTRTRPQADPRQQAYRGAPQVRPSSPRVTPREIAPRSRGEVGAQQRPDDRSSWRAPARTERPTDSGRVSGRDRGQQTETFDRDRRAENPRGTQPGIQDRNQNRVQPGSRYERQDVTRERTQPDARSRTESRHQTDTRYDGQRSGSSHQRYDQQYAGQTTQQFDGRVSRLEHASGGYRVWLDGGNHCFWVPEARFLLWPLRIGLSVSFGGFWNSAGYYNIYDYGPSFGGYYGNSYYGNSYYGNSYYGGSGYGGSYYGGSYYGSPYRQRAYQASSILQGYVDRFDDQDGTFVVRDDRSGRYATVFVRSGDPDFRYLQPGDWVSLSGNWTQSGYFEAYRIDDLSQR